MNEAIREVIENSYFKDALQGVLNDSEVTLIFEDTNGERKFLTAHENNEENAGTASQVYLSSIKIGSSRYGRVIGYDKKGKDQTVSLLVALTASLIMKLLSKDNGNRMREGTLPA